MTVSTKTFDENTRGVYLITVTPFTESGALDLDSTDRMVDFYLEQGVDGLTVLGILGEAPKLESMAKYRSWSVRRLRVLRQWVSSQNVSWPWGRRV
jgi:hypothetical protein